jgi:putative tricarboxylic transport membrane protein
MHFAEFLHQIGALLTPTHVTILVGAVVLGIIFGALPGLTATLGVALLTALTFNLTADNDPQLAVQYSMTALIGIYVGAIYGGSHPAVLLNIPGTGASAATAVEGYPLCQLGRGGEAIGLATVTSFFGTVIGVLAMLLVIPLLVSLAEQFTSVEYFLLALFGVLICGSLSSADTPVKGWIAGLLGLLMAAVGDSPLQGYPRYTFGSSHLAGGIEPIPVILGGFAVPQILRSLRSVDVQRDIARVLRVLPRWSDLRSNVATAIRSGLIGVGVGAIPGVGEDVAAWLSYDMAKKFSRHPERFGRGAMEGVVAAEAANNACIGGALVPLLALGIPGSPPAAMLLGAILLHNVTPGPMLAVERPEFIPMMCAILLLSSAAMLLCGFAMCRLSVYILRIPSGILMPLVGLFSVIGSYALDNSMINVYGMLAFGFVAYFMEEMGYPIGPLVIGIILGPMADENLRRALMAHQGSLLPFVSRPLALVLLGLIVYSLIGQTRAVRAAFRAVTRRQS